MTPGRGLPPREAAAVPPPSGPPPPSTPGPGLDADVAAVLRDRTEAGPLSLTDSGPGEWRARFHEVRKILGGDEARVGGAGTGLTSSELGGVPVRRYGFPAEGEPAVVVVFLHGGGWVLGDLESFLDMTGRVPAARAAVASVVAAALSAAPRETV